MNEGLKPQIEPQAIRVEIGQVFRPFEGINLPPTIEEIYSLLNIDRNYSYKDYKKKSPGVSSNPFTAKEIMGKFLLVPCVDPIVPLHHDNHFIEGKNRKNTVTPLGQFTFSQRIQDGNVIVQNPPVTLETRFRVTNNEQLDDLGKYAVEVTLGKERYTLRSYGRGNISPEKLQDLKDETGAIEVGSYQPRDENLREVFILLPYDSNKIAQIETKIVEK